MFKRMSLTVVLALLIGSLLAACGGGAPAPAPVTFSSLPVFSGAAESADANLAAFLASTIDPLKGDSAVASADGKAYDAVDATWDALKSFYTTELVKGGWTAGDGRADSQSFNRGKQTCIVRFAEGAGFIVILSEAK